MNKPINCPVVILCGGKSSRMGSDKCLLPFNGYDTLIEYQHHKLQKIFKEVYISSKEDKFEFLEDKTKLILDNSPEYSPMVALQKILQSFHNSYVFIIAVDIPFISEQIIEALYNSVEENSFSIIVPVDGNGNRHNLCGFYYTDVIDTINQLLEKDIHRIGALIQNSKVNEIDFQETQEFLNMNDQEQYQKACTTFSSFAI